MKNATNELEMAKQDKKKAFTNYFPSVSAAGTGFMADKGLMQMNLGPDMNMSMLKNGIAGGVGASLPLFTGGQIVNGNQLAKVGVEVKRLQRNLSDNEVCLTTEQYFWRVVILKEKLKTLSKVEAQLARILSDVEASVQAGIVTRNDLLQVGKPCWMLNYTGEPHWPTKIANKIDFQKRMFQFFNHYLKKEAMPEWMSDGVPAVEQPYELGY